MSELEKAKKTVERAFLLMERHAIHPTPANVMAWYTYAGKSDADWNRKLDQYLANRTTLPVEKQDEMLCHFVLGLLECKALFQGVNGVYSAVSSVLNHLAKAEGETSEFGKVLKGTAKTLEGATTLDEAKGTVAAVVELAEKMAERQLELAQELKDSSEEVFILRNRLEEVHRQAITDDLTDLGNRRYFDARLRELVDETAQTGQDLALVLLDIDRFKDFNDQHGHATGDNVLKLVAGIVKSATRGTDVAARIGGEEFGVILPRTSLKDATSLAERIRKTLYSRELVKRGAQESLGRITISSGVGGFRAGQTTESLFEAVNKCLYQAKREGRNRVITDT